ncbi:MAG TPA: SDR family oxidoreductase [Thermoanaerobaculia bacterium]
MRFRDKVVWVTGASSGIGEAVAVAFSREGAKLILSSRNAAELERVRQACAGDGHRVVPLDLTRPDSFPAVGDVDVLVHSGGVSQRSLVVDTDLATDRAIMDLNFFGTVALTKAVLPSMLARKSGHIVPISSVVGYVGTPLRSTYAASKHALHGFFDSLRAEVAKDGIMVTIVCPGYVRTNVSRNALTGNGTAFGKMDDTHQDAMRPEECALRIVDAVANRKEEVVIGGKEAWAVPLKRFFPRLVSRLVRMK